MRDLIVDSAAERELIDILAYHDQHWRANGVSLITEFERAFLDIRTQPLKYPTYGRRHRVCILSGLPFVIFFQVLPSAVWIAAISHGHRRPNYWGRRQPPTH